MDKKDAEKNKANLRGADLRRANLWGADLRKANLQGANLEGANLWKANLWKANLRVANLQEADLRGANLDLSAFPLSCGSFNMKIDSRLIWQLICHITRLDIAGVSDDARIAVESLDHWKNKFCEYRDDVKPI